MADAYNQAVGRRLRAIRRQKGLSLQDVEALSDQQFKASVLGAYERGERSLSLPRMQRLAGFYGVPVDQLLPAGDRSRESAPIRWDTGGVTLDLEKIDQATGADAEVIERFLSAIQIMRQDFNGKVLTIRGNDLRMLAHLLDTDEAGLSSMLTPVTD
ncbi:MAG: transcriptional regulator [Acidimicrobiia bacterium]